ncbi:AraC family transcriptional regulator [Pseudomonas sp. GD03944]|uniref:AraC family transcriptional regulator n=1 Tax=Pseudomonas sp. GD03944 TaxID=2975409 RepID=UPI00244AC9DD|nr:AraC family transcriptional regulator [Pseudomonas sp. GD03944]MDH1261626.1 AraC family transcriptional regulator [Pseudomonas sp. GD03944]
MSRLSSPRKPSPAARFWRDDALPFIEARQVEDGRELCYARHSHETFSIGVITRGESTYINREVHLRVCEGTVVLMNPGDVHACNPIDGLPWSYVMLYVDAAWLGGLQHALGLSEGPGFQPLSAIMSPDRALYDGVVQLYGVLTDDTLCVEDKQDAATAFFTRVLRTLETAPLSQSEAHDKLQRAAAFMQAHCAQALKIDDICAAAELSPSYLTRAFKKLYGMTPHAFLLNQRVQLARLLLKRGESLAEVALASGFADQAHFQRAFKQLLAATPGQYKG